MKMHSVRLKRVMRYDPRIRKFRIARLMWVRGVCGSGGGYSTKLSVSLVPMLIGWSRGLHEWRMTLLGVQLHYLRSYGGLIC